MTWPSNLQLPFDNELAQHTFRISGRVQIDVSSGQPTTLTDWPELVTNSFVVPLVHPGAAQHLHAAWQADREKWRLQVTDSAGGRVTAPLTAWMWASSTKGRTLGVIDAVRENVWAGVWEPYLMAGGSPLSVDIWVAGPGYVTTLLTETVPGP
jgi:hypothetical protein